MDTLDQDIAKLETIVTHYDNTLEQIAQERGIAANKLQGLINRRYLRDEIREKSRV